jgi:hypothetical protein
MGNDRATTSSEVTVERLAEAYKQTAVVAWGIAASLLMYVVVAEVWGRAQPGADPPSFFGTLRVALFVVAAVTIPVATIARNLVLRNPPPAPAARAARFRVATLTALALGEVPAVCGLVLVVVGRARTDFYMLLVISAYMTARHFPRRGPWEEYVRRGGAGAVR